MTFDFRLDAAALRFASDILESAINAGDVAEVAAPVEGGVGRPEAISQRDEIYEDPAGWLRGIADGLERDWDCDGSATCNSPAHIEGCFATEETP